MRRVAWVFFSLVVTAGCRAPARSGSDAISLREFVEPASRLFVTLQGQRSEVITLPLGTKLANFPVEIQPGTVLEFSLALLSGIDPGHRTASSSVSMSKRTESVPVRSAMS